MKAKVYLSNIYWNKGLASYFFREQSMETFVELVNRRSCDGDEFLNELDAATEGMDIDDVEEMFYSDSVEEIAKELGIELNIEEED